MISIKRTPIIILAYVCLFPLGLFAQKANIDSLLQVWENEHTEDSLRMDALNKIAWGYLFQQPDSSLYYGQQGINYSEETDAKLFLAKFNDVTGCAYSLKSDYEKSNDYVLKAIEIADKIGAKKNAAKYKGHLMENYRIQGKKDLVIQLGLEAIEDFKALDMQKDLGKTYLRLGRIYKNRDLAKAKEYFQKAMPILLESQNFRSLSLIHQSLSSIMLDEGKKEEAIKHLNKALEYNEKLGDEYNKTSIWFSFGTVYKFDDYDKALEYFNKSLQNAKKMGDKQIEAKIYSELGHIYGEIKNIEAAIKYELMALDIRKGTNDEEGIATSYGYLSVHLKSKGDIKQSLDYAHQALGLYEKIDFKDNIVLTLVVISQLYVSQGDFEKAIETIQKGIDFYKEYALENINVITSCYSNLGDVLVQKGEIEKGIGYMEKSLKLNQEVGRDVLIYSNYSNLGWAHYKLGEYRKAEEYANKAYLGGKEQGHKPLIVSVLNILGLVAYEKGNFRKALDYAQKGLVHAQSVKVDILNTNQELLYKSYKALGNKSKALEYYENFIALKDSTANEENQRKLLHQEYQYNYDKQFLADSIEFATAQEIKNLEIEKQQANIARQRIALTLSGLCLALIGFLAYFINKGKKRSDELLLNILPYETAQELKQKGSVEAKNFKQVTVLFTDFKEFTQMASRLSPQELVKELDECFKAFDRIIDKYNIEKIKTIGDAYMAASGLPVANKTHPKDMVNAAIEIRDFILERKKKTGKNGFEVRIGIHTGPVVAGIVGIKKFQYDLWGDTVNIAARMESNSEVGKINISHSTYNEVKDLFDCTYRGEIEAKGKGFVKMYFVQ